MTIVTCCPAKEIKGVSSKAFKEMKASKARIISINSIEKLKVSRKAVIVDALIGTGIKGNLRKNIKDSILALNRLGTKLPVVSLDIASGVNPDTGGVEDICVYADITTTLLLKKEDALPQLGKKFQEK